MFDWSQEARELLAKVGELKQDTLGEALKQYKVRDGSNLQSTNLIQSTNLQIYKKS